MADDTTLQFKPGTAAWLFAKQVRGGEASVRDALGKYASRTEPYCVAKRGETMFRRDIDRSPGKDSDGAAERIAYLDYSPPSIWQPFYSLQHVTFPSAPIHQLMTHPGEELLATIAGKIQYEWVVPRGDDFDLQRYRISQPVSPGQLLRVNPSIPHCTRAEGRSATAWMAHLDISRNTIAIRSKREPTFPTGAIRSPRQTPKNALEPRVTSEEQLKKRPELYAMLATGLAATIRLLRTSPDMDITKLAEVTELDRAQLSRIESGQTNVMMEKLDKIGEALGFDFTEFFLKPLWVCQRYDLGGNRKLGSSKKSEQIEIAPAGERFYLHHHYVEVAKTHHHRQPAWSPQGSMSSWIILDGDAIINMGDNFNPCGERQSSRTDIGEELLKPGQVIHFRRPLDCRVEARKRTKILAITCSSLDPACWPEK